VADTVRTRTDLLSRLPLVVGAALAANNPSMSTQTARDIVAAFFAKRAGSIAGVRAMSTAGIADGDEIAAFGYGAPGEHPGVVYFWDSANTQADNSGTVLAPSDGSAGRWVMAPYAEYDCRWWGCIGDDGNADDVPFQLCVNQMHPGRTILVPAARQGYNLRFVMRLTDQITTGDSMWLGQIRCAGLGYGAETGTTGLTYLPFHCDFDDSDKSLFQVNATMEFVNLRVAMDSNTTTVLTTGQNGSGTPMGVVINGGNIKQCGGHGILSVEGVGFFDQIRIDHADGVSDIQNTGSGYVGMFLTSDDSISRTEIAAGFHYGAVYTGNNWTSTDVYHDQCRIGALVAGIEGRINGGRCAFNWSAGIKIGAGALATIAGQDVSGNDPRQIDLNGVQFHSNGEDRVGSSDNLNSTDIWLDAVGASRIRINGGRGGNQIDNDTFDEATHGLRVAGSVIDHFSAHGVDFSGYVSGETIFYAASDTLWATSQAKSIGDLVYNTISGNDHVYRATTAGTTGGTAPTHIDGEIVSDGAVNWAHCGIRNEDTNAVVEFHRSTIEQGDSIIFVDRQTWYGGTKTTDGEYDPAV